MVRERGMSKTACQNLCPYDLLPPPSDSNPAKVTQEMSLLSRKQNSGVVKHIQSGTRLCQFKSLTISVTWSKLLHLSVLQFPQV